MTWHSLCLKVIRYFSFNCPLVKASIRSGRSTGCLFISVIRYSKNPGFRRGWTEPYCAPTTQPAKVPSTHKWHSFLDHQMSLPTLPSSASNLQSLERARCLLHNQQTFLRLSTPDSTPVKCILSLRKALSRQGTWWHMTAQGIRQNRSVFKYHHREHVSPHAALCPARWTDGGDHMTVHMKLSLHAAQEGSFLLQSQGWFWVSRIILSHIYYSHFLLGKFIRFVMLRW